MIEIYEKLRTQTQVENNSIDIQISPEELFGRTVSDSHRLLLFTEKLEQSFYIDFVAHAILPGRLFIIPFGHVLYLPEIATEFYCVSISSFLLNREEKAWIYQQKYKAEKAAKVEGNIINYLNNPGNHFLTGLFDLHYLKRPDIQPSSQYIYLADKLCNALLTTQISFELNITQLMQWIHSSDKTLRRICQTVFNQNPKYIIRYHVLLKIIFRIVIDRHSSFKEISFDLGFKDTSSFVRYVKSISGFTPTEIRYKFPSTICDF